MIPNYLHSKVLALFCSNMSNKNFSVLLMLIAPAVWYILLITPETKKPPACTMYSLAHRLYEYYNATHSYKVLQTIFLDYMQLIATKSSKPSSLEEGYPGGLDPHQKRMQPPALQHTSPLPSLWDRASCRRGPLMPAHHLSMTQGRGFLQIRAERSRWYLIIFFLKSLPCFAQYYARYVHTTHSLKKNYEITNSNIISKNSSLKSSWSVCLPLAPFERLYYY